MNLPTPKDLAVVKDESFIISLITILFFIVPGTAVIFVFYVPLFQSLDWVRLILLSVAITSPLVATNTFVFLFFLRNTDNKDGSNMFTAFFLSSFLSGWMLYAIVVVHYLFGRGLSEGAIVMGACNVLLLLIISHLRKGNRGHN